VLTGLNVNHVKLEKSGVTLHLASFLRGAQIRQHGELVRREKRSYSVTGDNGEPVVIRLATRFYDIVPRVFVDNEEISVAPALKWYQYVWACLPLCLVVLGGVIGAMFGIFAAYTNIAMMRSTHGKATRYLYTFTVSVAACLGSLLVSTTLLALLK
jgi:hypothetical protein